MCFILYIHNDLFKYLFTDTRFKIYPNIDRISLYVIFLPFTLLNSSFPSFIIFISDFSVTLFVLLKII